MDHSDSYSALLSCFQPKKYKTLFKRRKLEEEGVEESHREVDKTTNPESVSSIETGGEELKINIIKKDTENRENETEVATVESEVNVNENINEPEMNANEPEMDVNEREESDTEVEGLNNTDLSPTLTDDSFTEMFGHVLASSDTVLESGKSQKFHQVETAALKRASGDAKAEYLMFSDGNFPKECSTLEEFKVKPRLIEKWRSVKSKKRKRANAENEGTRLTHPIHETLFPILNNYSDLWVSVRSSENEKSLEEVTMLHVINHVLKTRDRITKNNTKLKSSEKSSTELECRDQGFTRPTVLFLVPFRNSAYRLVQLLLKLLPISAKAQIMNHKRFNEEYGPEGIEKIPEEKPADYRSLFEGNSDDCFRLGIALPRGKSVKLYSDFYRSDIIIASPLGLKMVLDGGSKGSESSVDFLSSIEILAIPQADAILMQNWEHVRSVVHAINQRPSETRDTDLFRVREYHLQQKSRFYRQTIIFSSLIHSEFRSFFARECACHRGRVRIRQMYSGILTRVVAPVRQIFQRFDCDRVKDVMTNRFEFFKKEILPQLRASTEGHTLIYIPHYFDFVMVRNLFKELGLFFTSCSEYTDQADVSRARSNFFHSRVEYMLLTGRFHFFKRLRIRGIKNLVFYGLPVYPQFYHEFVNVIESGENTCMALFSKFDA
eukprot:720421_1